jgi:hypothetical protein
MVSDFTGLCCVLHPQHDSQRLGAVSVAGIFDAALIHPVPYGDVMLFWF